MNAQFTGNDVIGLPGQNLTDTELRVLVGLADGETPSAIGEAVNIDRVQQRHIEGAIQGKLGAKTKTHMISRGFILGVLAPRSLCLLLSVMACGGGDHMIRARQHGRSRTNPYSVRVLRSSQSGNGRGRA